MPQIGEDETIPIGSSVSAKTGIQELARHPNKEIEAALQHAETQGWSVIESPRGHCWA